MLQHKAKLNSNAANAPRKTIIEFFLHKKNVNKKKKNKD
jgi:hypothetical protein